MRPRNDKKPAPRADATVAERLNIHKRPQKEGERAPEPAERRERRSLSHVGGPTRAEGDEVVAQTLRHALNVPTSLEAEELARAHVHGFHSYPARMHPLTARRLVEGLSSPSQRVLDPFCGSGTVLVEARLALRSPVGVDANPLAVRLASVKLTAMSEDEGRDLIALAKDVAAVAEDRRIKRVGASRRYEDVDVALFSPHVLLELDGLRVGLDMVRDAKMRATLELSLSSILTKVSRSGSDTAQQQRGPEKRIAAGYPSKLFVKKTEELTRRFAEVAPTLSTAPPFQVLEGDARKLDGVPNSSIALVVTSPPYPGNYDYLEHHAARLRWLRMPAGAFDQREMGARRRLERMGHAAARDAWRTELTAALSAMARVLTPKGKAVLLIADSVVSGAPLYAEDDVEFSADRAGLEIIAVASQERPHFHYASQRAFAQRPRAEHAIALAKIRPA